MADPVAAADAVTAVDGAAADGAGNTEESGVGAGSGDGEAGADSLGCMPNAPGRAAGFPLGGGSGSSVGAASAVGPPSVLACCLP